jgi:hypothetical protein
MIGGAQARWSGSRAPTSAGSRRGRRCSPGAPLAPAWTQPRPQQPQPQPRLYSSAPPARSPRGASVRARVAAEDAAARRLPPGLVRQTWGVDAAAFGVELGLGRIVALYHRSSTLCQIHEHIRCINFRSDNATETLGRVPPARSGVLLGQRRGGRGGRR